MTLDEGRFQIDSINRKLIELLAQRTAISKKLGKLKTEAGLPTFDPKREQAILAEVEQLAKRLDLDPEFAKSLMQQIMDHSKQIQIE